MPFGCAPIRQLPFSGCPGGNDKGRCAQPEMAEVVQRDAGAGPHLRARPAAPEGHPAGLPELARFQSHRVYSPPI